MRMSVLQNAPHTPAKPITVRIEPTVISIATPVTMACSSADTNRLPILDNTIPVASNPRPLI